MILFNSCKEENNTPKAVLEPTKEYEYRRAVLQYDLNDSIMEELEIYVSRSNDTTGYQVKRYHEQVIDSSKSIFYTLNLYREEGTNRLGGKINYHFDSLTQGKLGIFTFSVLSKSNNKTTVLDLENYNRNSNSIDFLFPHDSDTLMGLIYAQHWKDTIDNGEDKLGFKQVLLAVDNYNETDNPFVGVELE